MRGGSEPLPFSWEELVPLLIHPLRVTIIETLRYVGEPLSSADLRKTLYERYALSLISYHLLSLARVGAVAVVDQNKSSDATENLYFFPTQR